MRASMRFRRHLHSAAGRRLILIFRYSHGPRVPDCRPDQSVSVTLWRTRQGSTMTIKARVLVPFFLGFLWCVAPFARADTAGKGDAEPVYTIKSIAERHLDRLPAGPLFWRIERFPTLAQAQQAAGPASLTAEIENKGWLF